MSAFPQEIRSHRIARSPSDASIQPGVTSSCGYMDAYQSRCTVSGISIRYVLIHAGNCPVADARH